MKSKFKILIIFVTLAFSLSIMSNTYSRYVADASEGVELTFAKWQILVNNNDITDNLDHTAVITPTILENKNVASNKLAPSSIGYYDIEIDPSNVETSFNYSIEILNNVDMPDLIMTKYEIIDDLKKEEYEIIDNTINGTLDYTIEGYKPFTIRIYFMWYDGINNTMSDIDDTNIAKQENVTIATNISFEQKIG